MAALTAAFALALPLGASGNGPLTGHAQAAEASVSTAAKTLAASSTSTVRPATQNFSVMVKGKETKRKATLQQGKGYSLYVAAGYTFSAAKNKIYLTQYPSYQAKIEKLPAGYKLETLRKQGKAELKKYGEVRSYIGDQLYESPMYNAKLFLQTSSKNNTTHNYIVWTSKTGESYLFRVTVPESEFAGTFTTIIGTSLTSILAK
ncbi:hypothetical protein B9G55_15215 [Saccharibacillus sp. O16]|nr:hypothetical protein B9G55_15215 [Saccharibacillus sp. O16]